MLKMQAFAKRNFFFAGRRQIYKTPVHPPIGCAYGKKERPTSKKRDPGKISRSTSKVDVAIPNLPFFPNIRSMAWRS